MREVHSSELRLEARWVLALFVAAAVGMLIGAQVANAWTPENMGCNVPYEDYRLVNWGDEAPPSALGWDGLAHYDWTSGSILNFVDGADNWEDVKRSNGAVVVDIRRLSQGGIPFYHVELDQDGASGVVVCDSASGQLYGAVDYTEGDGGPLLNDHQQGLATHEMGHAVALHHVGKLDNRWNAEFEPTMVGGGAKSYAALRTLTPDDWVNLTNYHLSDGYLTANGYFSQGSKKGWAVIKGSAVYKATGGYGNTPYMQMEGKPSRVRTESWLWYNGAITVDGAASFKVADQGAVQGGNAQIRVYVRRLEATGTDEVFDFLTTPTSEPDINEAAYSGNWILTATTEVTSPAGAFVTYSTLNYQIPSTWEGSAVRIRINNSLVDGSSNSVPLYVDNARIREL